MYFSDDSIIYELTCSGDERIEKELQQYKEDGRIRKEREEQIRKDTFERVFQETAHEVFKLPGLRCMKFTHFKIKFSFVPSDTCDYVSKKVIFYCSLKYHEKYEIWTVRRDSFPANIKWRIYRLFYTGDGFKVVDALIIDTIIKIYNKLVNWADEEENFRLEKFSRYQHGEDIFLDSDDEELFLNEDQKRELHEKRQRILQRMLPPTSKSRRVLRL